MVTYINQKFKFDQFQYGFQCQSSTLSAAVDFLEQITTELDKNKYVVVVYVDLKKAFDTVNIELLLDELLENGCTWSCK